MKKKLENKNLQQNKAENFSQVELQVLKKLPYKKIPSSRFRYDNWVGANYISIFTVWDFDNYKAKPEWQVIGYCKAEHLPMRENKGKYGVMFERIGVDGTWMHDDRLGERIWMHLDFLTEEEFESQI